MHFNDNCGKYTVYIDYCSFVFFVFNDLIFVLGVIYSSKGCKSVLFLLFCIWNQQWIEVGNVFNYI